MLYGVAMERGATAEQREAFGHELERRLMGLNRAEFARKVAIEEGRDRPHPEQQVSAWIKGETITPTGGQPAVMTAVTIREADGKLWHAGGIWQEAIDAYLAVKSAAKSAGPEAVAAVQHVNRDALMVLQEYAPGPKARASLQAEIDAAATP